MILYSTRNGKSEPELIKFKGGRYELSQHNIYKSFSKARKMYIEDLKNHLEMIKDKIKETEELKSPEDLPMNKNPF